ncbi:reactivating factor for ethanolamine ammonia lyase [Photobacterium aquae]|uniref:Reactivating factor for ethanolamine ammonia lyase n=1 Tax=Photobacterium aquae TaxID=1195763 RepID=A0A0J1H5S6_9GAMM|nr:ethanolamine ammonia-lyase reactivating factor EutA [Photobacterium aquae]KLV07105.1 reactivating factor for ethanolamine ammonia lyase [Photobacterium aquae]
MERKTIHSVGIDIGTTTTQVIFSDLTVVNRAPASQVPVYEFVEREITYQSPVEFTPINYQGTLDAQAVRQFIEQQIQQAGLAAEGVETGAIIITGETAKAHNARTALLDLSQQLGDFVVATAGPNLESVIAGRGSGAQERSAQQHQRIMNIDIGGGTSNYVVFDCGRVVETACLNIGGRLVELDQEGNVAYLHKPALAVIKSLFGEALHPRQVTQDHLKRVVDRMAELIVEVMLGELSPLAVQLLQTPAMSDLANIDAVYLSGGVGECYYRPPVTATLYGDVGPALAQALQRNPSMAASPVQPPSQTVRATVIGAGAYSLSLSGATIWLNSAELPIKNIPVIHPAIDWSVSSPALCEAICLAGERMDLALGIDRYAVAIDGGMPVTYAAVQHVAQELARFYQNHGNHHDPAFVIVHNDIGKALGMELQPQLAPQPVSVIDEVITREGDYIDIGKSYFGGEIVPLTVKSLAFPS